MEHDRSRHEKKQAWQGFLAAKEFEVKGVRSSGAGGQNVNKVATKAQLRFDVEASSTLSSEEKAQLRGFLTEKRPKLLTAEGHVLLSNSDTRSYEENKNRVIQKLYDLIEDALTPRLPRVPTKKPKSADARRLADKKLTSARKKSRSSRGDAESH